jgi:coproporphyrinogen III oxidase-like Fe-S oxidoreductase
MGFKRRFGVDFIEVFGAAASDLTSQGLLRLTAERCVATRRGMLFLDTVTAALAAQELSG